MSQTIGQNKKSAQKSHVAWHFKIIVLGVRAKPKCFLIVKLINIFNNFCCFIASYLPYSYDFDKSNSKLVSPSFVCRVAKDTYIYGIKMQNIFFEPWPLVYSIQTHLSNAGGADLCRNLNQPRNKLLTYKFISIRAANFHKSLGFTCAYDKH